MNILVTGCWGFIGSNLVPYLLKQGHRVIGFDNFSNCSIDAPARMKKAAGRENWLKFKIYNLDITSFKFMHSVCVNEKIDMIVHLAARGSVPRSFDDPRGTFENNIIGFSNICQLAAAMNIKRLVYASSSSVHGIGGRLLSPYAMSKKANEDFARIWLSQTNVEHLGLRFFNVYGPGQKFDSAYSAVIPRLIMSKDPVIYGDGKQSRDFTYVDDVCVAIEAALLSPHSNDCIDVGKGESNSVNDIVDILGITPKYVHARQGDIVISQADVKFSEMVLNYKPSTPLEHGLLKTKEYYHGLARK